MIRVGVLGASGFGGAELLRLIAGHPDLDLVAAAADSQAGAPVAELYPSLAPAYGDLVFAPMGVDAVGGVDVAFCALPHGASKGLVPDLIGRVKHVIDLAADFRFDDQFVYGLPELYRDDVAAADHVAVPGCYPTSAALALVPLVRAGLVEADGIVVDAASGVSGAGRKLQATTAFCTVDEDFRAYGLLDHRHTAEIERAVGGTVLFTPHLAPMNRGILATCYARPIGGASNDAVMGALDDAYADEQFVTVRPEPPSTKATLGSNSAHVTARHDPRTGWVVSLCALDNLVKGAAGQAVQCANLLCGLDEGTGLPALGLMP